MKVSAGGSWGDYNIIMHQYIISAGGGKRENVQSWAECCTRLQSVAVEIFFHWHILWLVNEEFISDFVTLHIVFIKSRKWKTAAETIFAFFYFERKESNSHCSWNTTSIENLSPLLRSQLSILVLVRLVEHPPNLK